MLRATPGCRRISPARSRVRTHLVDGRWADAKVPLKIGFGGRPTEHPRICKDEGQILTLLGREDWHIGERRHR
jgi:hypothetical protein